MPSKVTDSQLNFIDPSNENNFIPLTQIYLGANVHKTLFQDPNIAANEIMIADIRRRCSRQFMITACIQIKEIFFKLQIVAAVMQHIICIQLYQK